MRAKPPSRSFRGVFARKGSQKWVAFSRNNAQFGKRHFDIGVFPTQEEAAKAFDWFTVATCGRAAAKDILNFKLKEYDQLYIPDWGGKSRQEVLEGLRYYRKAKFAIKKDPNLM